MNVINATEVHALKLLKWLILCYVYFIPIKKKVSTTVGHWWGQWESLFLVPGGHLCINTIVVLGSRYLFDCDRFTRDHSFTHLLIFPFTHSFGQRICTSTYCVPGVELFLVLRSSHSDTGDSVGEG